MTALVKSLGRAFGGALLFSMPLLMTHEMWQLAQSIDPWRLALLIALSVALVFFLSRDLGGATGPIGWRDALADAGVAFLMAALAVLVVLSTLRVVHPFTGSWREALLVVGFETVPAAIGAAYARSQLGETDAPPAAGGYRHELFLMAAGAVVFAANIAPTREVLTLGSELDAAGAMALLALTLLLMHAFVYWIGFKGEEPARGGALRAFTSLTLVGYVIALGLSLYLLWTFDRFEGASTVMILAMTLVLGLPAALGAAVARLIL